MAARGADHGCGHAGRGRSGSSIPNPEICFPIPKFASESLQALAARRPVRAPFHCMPEAKPVLFARPALRGRRLWRWPLASERRAASASLWMAARTACWRTTGWCVRACAHPPHAHMRTLRVSRVPTLRSASGSAAHGMHTLNCSTYGCTAPRVGQPSLCIACAVEPNTRELERLWPG